MKQCSDLKYVHQDSLSGTSLMTDSSGASMGIIKYAPYGATRSGSVPTDKLFTGQRLDGTGLYYYGARYYDPGIGRFISPDTIIPNPANPQSLNRYTYVLNNPLKYTDPSGHIVLVQGWDVRSLYNDAGNYFYGMMPSQWEIDAIISQEFQVYDQLRNGYSRYTEYLETTEELFCITPNDSLSQTDLVQIEYGATLLRMNATSTSTSVYRYTPNGF